MAKYRIVLDTNIFISAILFGGMPEQVLNLARFGLIEIFVSKEILEEIIRILRVKFDWGKNQISEVEAEIEALTRQAKPEKMIKFVKSDPDDNKFLEVAIGSKSDFIISGDKHLLDLSTYGGVKIVTAREFVEFIAIA